MNESEPKVEIFKPFGEAFELTKTILFRPFDLGKWCVIGFAAFLAGHYAAGGAGFSLPIPPGKNTATLPAPNNPFSGVENWPWFGVAIVIFVVVVLVLVLLLMWLKARGSFVLTDCIVRNRGAIEEPWREYRREGNSYFLFTLALAFGVMVMFGLLGLAIIPLVGLASKGNWIPLVVVGVLLFIAWFLLALFLGVVIYFMVPVMYIRRCRALDAFREVILLVRQNLWSFLLLGLFVIVLGLGQVAIGSVVVCATCCLAALPYVGTVFMLPVFVCLHGFGLLFLRQFGPNYDVWSGVVPEPPPLPPSAPPLPA